MQLVSVITVVYNDKIGLQRTISSLSCQTYKDYEYLVIDGGSTDGTVDVINANISQIGYFVSEPDKGIYDAMNKGIMAAHGQWLIFMNAGDIFADSRVLERIEPYLKGNSDGVVYGKILQIYGKRKEISANLVGENPDAVDFIIKTIPHQAAFIKRSMFDIYGLYDEQYKLAADQIWFMKVIGIYHEQCCYIDMIVAHFMAGGSNEIHRDICLKEKDAAFEKEFGKAYPYLKELAEYRNSAIIRRLLKIRLWARNNGLTSGLRKIVYFRK